MKSAIVSFLPEILAVLGSVAAAAIFAYFLEHRWNSARRKVANGVNGWQLSILGSIYAVLLGFMLSDAWLAYQSASAEVSREAAAALRLYRIGQRMPDGCADRMTLKVQSYLHTVVATEWPSMETGDRKDDGKQVIRQMWLVASECKPNATSLVAADGLVDAIQTLQRERDAREASYESRLPIVLWFLLSLGAIAVVASSAILSNEHTSVHFFHVISLTILITFALVTIADLDRPFDGFTKVSPSPFLFAQKEIGGSSR